MTKKFPWSLNCTFLLFFLSSLIKSDVTSAHYLLHQKGVTSGVKFELFIEFGFNRHIALLKAAISLVKWRCPLSWLSVGSVASERTEKYLIVTYKCLVTTFSFQSNLDFSNPRDLLQDHMEGTTGDNHVLGPKCRIPDPKRA